MKKRSSLNTRILELLPPLISKITIPVHEPYFAIFKFRIVSKQSFWGKIKKEEANYDDKSSD